jgi:hypothetical protein
VLDAKSSIWKAVALDLAGDLVLGLSRKCLFSGVLRKAVSNRKKRISVREEIQHLEWLNLNPMSCKWR